MTGRVLNFGLRIKYKIRCTSKIKNFNEKIKKRNSCSMRGHVDFKIFMQVLIQYLYNITFNNKYLGRSPSVKSAIVFLLLQISCQNTVPTGMVTKQPFHQTINLKKQNRMKYNYLLKRANHNDPFNVHIVLCIRYVVVVCIY